MVDSTLGESEGWVLAIKHPNTESAHYSQHFPSGDCTYGYVPIDFLASLHPQPSHSQPLHAVAPSRGPGHVAPIPAGALAEAGVQPMASSAFFFHNDVHLNELPPPPPPPPPLNLASAPTSRKALTSNYGGDSDCDQKQHEAAGHSRGNEADRALLLHLPPAPVYTSRCPPASVHFR